MYRPRIIPVLLLQGKGLVKSTQFKNHRYIGDPINAVKIFNDLEADEIVFIDIAASKEKRSISLEFVKNVGEEANMPFAVGGGIRSIEEIRDILNAGAEKVIINTAAMQHPELIEEASSIFGSSAIVVCIDVKKNIFGNDKACFLNGSRYLSDSPEKIAVLMQERGAGELIIQSIDLDGTMQGYNLSLIKKISENVTIPVIALGGAGNLIHLQQAYEISFASGLGAGSMFVYYGKRNAILINYPSEKDKKALIKS